MQFKTMIIWQQSNFYRQAFSNIKVLESHSTLKPIFSGLEQVFQGTTLTRCQYYYAFPFSL